MPVVSFSLSPLSSLSLLSLFSYLHSSLPSIQTTMIPTNKPAKKSLFQKRTTEETW